jgi:outer membrane protein OmpA-like peptidoglycan-associated protein
MKRICVLCFILTASSLFAIDDFFIGLGPEINKHTREGPAYGGGLTAGLSLNPDMALGIKMSFSGDFVTVSAFEPVAFFRYYLPLPIKGFFAQAEAGGIVFFEYGERFPAFFAAAAGGWRYTFKNNFYIEPTIRGGYPIGIGIGITAGIKIPIKTGDEEREEKARREALATEITAILERRHVADTTAVATNEGVMITLYNIQFAADSAELVESEKAKLGEVANILKNIPARRIMVTGHTADTGNRRGELAVSRARAWAVADYLVELGARTHGEVAVSGYGASRPVADNATPEGRSANRRVEIIILGN